MYIFFCLSCHSIVLNFDIQNNIPFMTCWTQFTIQQSCILIYFIQGLKSELEKSSPSLGRTAIYVKDSRINALPRYQTTVIVKCTICLLLYGLTSLKLFGFCHKMAVLVGRIVCCFLWSSYPLYAMKYVVHTDNEVL